MDNETLVALKESIGDWKKRAKGETIVKACPLCELTKKRDEGRAVCFGCIIEQRTGLDGCIGTPYWEDEKLGFPIYENNMVKFLESFLPKKEEVKKKFVIRDDDKQKEKDVEVELHLSENMNGVRLIGNNYTLMTFKDGKFRRVTCVDEIGIETDSQGRILEYE